MQRKIWTPFYFGVRNLINIGSIEIVCINMI